MKHTTTPTLLKTLVLIGLATGLTHCAKKAEDDSNPSNSPSLSQKELYQQDMQSVNTSLAQAFDSYAVRNFTNPAQFRKFFGSGTINEAALRKYLAERISLVFDDKEMQTVSIAPDRFAYEGWLTEEQDFQVNASNIGVLLWFRGLVNQTSVTLLQGANVIPITSTRAGVVLLGPGYKNSITLNDGSVITLPPGYRLATLFHEARHSDCPSGISASDIEVMRRARSHKEFQQQYKNHQCGHLHKVCPAGHEYQGIAACDGAAWGPYFIGGALSEASISIAGSELDRQIYKINAADDFGRLQYSRESLYRGNLGEPQMENKGYRP